MRSDALLTTVIACFCVHASVTIARGGDPAVEYAVGKFDPAFYEYVHRELLFTHDDDDRLPWGLEHDLARDNIADLFNSFGLVTTLEAFEIETYVFYNVIGEQVGTTRPDEVYIVGAHFDAITTTFEPAPGADDNASGVAAILALARLLSPWPSEATIRYAAFDIEEFGLFGSTAYVEDHAYEDIQGMVSLDMLAFRLTPHAKARVWGRPTSDTVKDGLADAAATYAGIAVAVGGVNDVSDHAPFEWAGHPAALYHEYDLEDNPHYHQPTDSVDTPGYIDYRYASALSRGALAWLVQAAGVQVPPPSGDLNLDYRVTLADVNPFVLALSDPDAYAAAFPEGDWLAADLNGDGQVDFGDIEPFLDLFDDCDAPQVLAHALPPDANANDLFGVAVDLRGDTCVVGAQQAWTDGVDQGAVYVYEIPGGDMVLIDRLTAADGASRDFFGSALALDADRVVIGAAGADALGSASGAAYVFERVDDTWVETAKLLPDGGGAGDQFGAAVAIAGDTIVVGARKAEIDGERTGAAYVFDWLDGAWTQTARLVAPDPATNDEFGRAVACGGNTIAVGAPYHDTPHADAGIAHVFVRDGDGWVHQQTLQPEEPAGMLGFGTALALDDGLLLVGATAATLWHPPPGRVFVFEHESDAWVGTDELKPRDGFWSNHFGAAVDLDGGYAIVGAYGDLTLDSGRAYVFEFDEGVWSIMATYRPRSVAPDAMFGGAVALDDGRAVVGARLANWAGPFAGSAYLLAFEGDGTPRMAIAPNDAQAVLGEPVELRCVVEAPHDAAYQWFRDGQLIHDTDTIHGARTETLRIDSVEFADAGAYTLQARTICGTVVSPPALLDVIGPQSPPAAEPHPAPSPGLLGKSPA